jgi:hypothetical protein
VLLICLIILNMNHNPFQTVVLNQLETMSLLASMVTIYCGIFYIVQVTQEDIDNGIASTTSGSKQNEF